MRRAIPIAAWMLALAAVSFACRDGGPEARLAGYAVLPADTFLEGPTSGRFIGPANGRTPPFPDKQPVQGFSALLPDTGGTFLALADNGFGTRDNSPDFVLAVYRLRPDFAGTRGTVRWELAFRLRDPDRVIPFALTCDRPDVDALIRRDRLLTGADFDVESFRRLQDGSFWFGDEFGPWLLHTDASGRVLEPPVALPGAWAPENPLRGDREPNVHGSGGFEGMALGADGKLYPLLEKPLVGQEGQLNLYVFDPAMTPHSEGWTTRDPYRPPYKIRLDPGAVGVTEFTRLSGTRFLMVERDAGQGPEARLKRIYEVDLTRTDPDGFLRKRLVLDLLHVPDPDDVAGTGRGFFSFPFVTPEALAVLDPHRIVIANDNNYPFSVGRHAGTTGEPDDNEMILVRLR